jgi:hypothetical protein
MIPKLSKNGCPKAQPNSYFGIGKKQMPGVETTVGDRGS